MPDLQLNEELRDGIQEISNIAVGSAADKLARSFSTFVRIPIPSVRLVDAADILMALTAVEQGERVTAVTQPFFGPGVSGEALLICTDASMADLTQLMGHRYVDDDHQQIELVLEMAFLLNGSCIQGICDQLDIGVLLKHPSMLGQHASLSEMLSDTRFPWHQVLAVELNYAFEDYDITCDLLLLFHEDSLPVIFRQLEYLI